MKKSKDSIANSGDTIFTDTSGTQYFIMGKVRIKISEHFAKNGKTLGCLLEDVIQYAASAS